MGTPTFQLLAILTAAMLRGQQPLSEADFRACISPDGAAFCARPENAGKCRSVSYGVDTCTLQPGTYHITYNNPSDPYGQQLGTPFRIGRSNINVRGDYSSLPTIRRSGYVDMLMTNVWALSGVNISGFLIDGNRHGVAGLGCLPANSGYWDLNITSSGVPTYISSMSVINSPSHAVYVAGPTVVQTTAITYARSTGLYMVSNAGQISSSYFQMNGTAGVTISGSQNVLLSYSTLAQNRYEGSDPNPGGQVTVGDGSTGFVAAYNTIDGGNYSVPTCVPGGVCNRIPSPLDGTKSCDGPPPDAESAACPSGLCQVNDAVESWGTNHRYLGNRILNVPGTGISLGLASGVEISSGGEITTSTNRTHYAIAVLGPSSNVKVGCQSGQQGCSYDSNGPTISGPFTTGVHFDGNSGAISTVGVFRTSMSGFTSPLAACLVGQVSETMYLSNTPGNPNGSQSILSCQQNCSAVLSTLSNFPYWNVWKPVYLTTQSGCTWSATDTADWIVSSASNGTGPGILYFNDTSSPPIPLPRTASATVGGQLIRFTQAPYYLDSQYTFEDVPYGSPQYDLNGETGLGNAIALIKYYWLTNGCTATTFCPGDSLTKAQLATFLVRGILWTPADTASCKSGYPADQQPYPCGFGYTSSAYYDDANGVFFPYIQKLTDLGLATACGYRAFCPDSVVSRGEMAKLTIHAMVARGKLPSNWQYPSAPYFTDVPGGSQYFPYVQKIREQGIDAGLTSTTYAPGQVLTRAEMAAILVRAFFTAP